MPFVGLAILSLHHFVGINIELCIAVSFSDVQELLGAGTGWWRSLASEPCRPARRTVPTPQTRASGPLAAAAGALGTTNAG